MINLLNPTRKKFLRSARRNTVWRNYTLLIVASLIAINLVFGATALFVFGQENNYKDQRAANQKQLSGAYKSDKQKAQDFRKNLTTAKTIIDGQTNYSDIIIAVAQTIPSGCVMQNLTLDSQSFGEAQTFSFQCKTQTDSLRLKTAFQQNTKLFNKVNIVSTSQSSDDPTNPHKVSVILSAILLKPPSPVGGL